MQALLAGFLPAAVPYIRAPLADPGLRSCSLKTDARNLLHQMDST